MAEGHGHPLVRKTPGLGSSQNGLNGIIHQLGLHSSILSLHKFGMQIVVIGSWFIYFLFGFHSHSHSNGIQRPFFSPLLHCTIDRSSWVYPTQPLFKFHMLILLNPHADCASHENRSIMEHVGYRPLCPFKIFGLPYHAC